MRDAVAAREPEEGAARQRVEVRGALAAQVWQEQEPLRAGLDL